MQGNKAEICLPIQMLLNIMYYNNRRQKEFYLLMFNRVLEGRMSMAQTGIQFHARKSEIIDFVQEIVEKNDLRVYGISIFPKYESKEISSFDYDKCKNFEEIIVCKNKLNIEDEKQYGEYLDQKKGDLFIDLGKDDGVELVESSMGVLAKDSIDILWKKIITLFKKRLLKGAYVATPQGYKKYYPKHWYTVGAKEAYEKGIVIKPIGGWNYYML